MQKTLNDSTTLKFLHLFKLRNFCICSDYEHNPIYFLYPRSCGYLIIIIIIITRLSLPARQQLYWCLRCRATCHEYGWDVNFMHKNVYWYFQGKVPLIHHSCTLTNSIGICGFMFVCVGVLWVGNIVIAKPKDNLKDIAQGIPEIHWNTPIVKQLRRRSITWLELLQPITNADKLVSSHLI